MDERPQAPYDLVMIAEATLLADVQPPFDAAHIAAILSRVFHTTCGATLLGGLMYLRFVLAPAAVDAQDPELIAFVGRRTAWGLCVAICSLLLIGSGVYNLMLVMGNYKNLPPLYHQIFGAKVLLALAVMFIAAVIAGKSSLAQKARANMTTWLNAAIVLALALFVCSATLRSIRDLPDARVAPPVVEDAPVFGLEGDAGVEGDMNGIEIEIGE